MRFTIQWKNYLNNNIKDISIYREMTHESMKAKLGFTNAV